MDIRVKITDRTILDDDGILMAMKCGEADREYEQGSEKKRERFPARFIRFYNFKNTNQLISLGNVYNKLIILLLIVNDKICYGHIDCTSGVSFGNAL